MTRLLTFPDGFTLNFQPSGNTGHSTKVTQNPNGGYQLWDDKGELVLLMEVVNDSVRAHWFENIENHKTLVNKISDIHDYLGVEYQPSAGSLTRWLVLPEADERILTENFTGILRSQIYSKDVIFRDHPLVMEKEFSEKSIHLLYLMLFAGCEEGFVQLLRNGTSPKEECFWCRIPLPLLTAKIGTFAMLEEICRNPQVSAGTSNAAFVREALRSKNEEMAKFAISRLPEDNKEKTLENVFLNCLKDQDLPSSLLLSEYEFNLRNFTRAQDVLDLWKSVVGLRSLPILEKVLNKVPHSHLMIHNLRLLVANEEWPEALAHLNRKGAV